MCSRSDYAHLIEDHELALDEAPEPRPRDADHPPGGIADHVHAGAEDPCPMWARDPCPDRRVRSVREQRAAWAASWGAA